MGKPKEDDRTGVTFDLTPMIDCTFQLLIFFMCTIKFKQLEGKLAAYLPKDKGVNEGQIEQPIENIDIVLSVVNEGRKVDPKTGAEWRGKSSERFLYQGRSIQYAIGPKKLTTVEDVKDRLVELYDKSKPTEDQRPVLIGPRNGIVNSEVVAVLDAAVQVGFTQITFKGAEAGPKTP
jgi:biopolymer transport protein ExbD